MKTIHSEDAPKAIGPYSQAIQVGQHIYCAGQVGFDPKTGELISADFKQQAIQAFANLKAVLKAANCTLKEVVKMTIYLTDFADFATLNEVMKAEFASPYPARTTVQVSALPKGAKLELDAIAITAMNKSINNYLMKNPRNAERLIDAIEEIEAMIVKDS